METPQEYKTRMLGYVAGREPLKLLEANFERLEAIIAKLEGKNLKERPSADRWSAAEIISHLAEAEIVVAYRFRKMLSANGGPIEAYDQNVWVGNAKYLQADPRLALSLLHTVRKANLGLLRSLTPQQWEYYGMHSERGRESVADLTTLTAGHDINHLKQMERIAEE